MIKFVYEILKNPDWDELEIREWPQIWNEQLTAAGSRFRLQLYLKLTATSAIQASAYGVETRPLHAWQGETPQS